MANINVYGTFNSMAEDQTVAKAAQIYDDNKLKNQQTINQELEEKIDNLDFNAENIGYDRTQTPDLGEGDVQSAIVALDGKVEAVDARIDDEKVEFIKERFPLGGVNELYTQRNKTTVTFHNVTDGSGIWILDYQASTNYVGRWTEKKIPKGSLVVVNVSMTSSAWMICGWDSASPQEYYTEHSNSIVDYVIHNRITSTNALSHTYSYIMPDDGYLIWQLRTNITTVTINVYDPTLLTDLYTEYYQKGVADGSGMASIVGLGYNIWDYVSGAVNMEGFEYGCKFFKENPAITHTSGGKFSDNTSLVYLPKCDVTGMKTNLDNTFFDCTNLVCVPKLTFNGSATTQNMFSGCTKLRVIGELNGLTITTNRYMFANTTSLQRIEGIDITSVVNSTNSTTANMFRSSSRTSGCTARYILFKGLGYSSMTKHYFANATYWGVNNADNPDALQSLIDTLYTYSADRSGGTACTIYLSTNSKNALNSATIDGESAIEKITAKGYTIA